MKDMLQNTKKSMKLKEILGSLFAVFFILFIVFTKSKKKEIKLDLLKYDSVINKAKKSIDSLDVESKSLKSIVESKNKSIQYIYIQYEKDTTYVNSMPIDSIQSWFTDRYKQ
jgi:hypothetical protein